MIINLSRDEIQLEGELTFLIELGSEEERDAVFKLLHDEQHIMSATMQADGHGSSLSSLQVNDMHITHLEVFDLHFIRKGQVGDIPF